MSLKYEMEDETPDDIIAEIRGRDDLNGDPWLDNFHIEYGEYGGWDGLELLKAYGERFAAAVKRERETATKCTGLGNAAQLREALEAISSAISVKGNVAMTKLSTFDIKRLAEAALTAPPRNCDVGTAKEQAVRKAEYCERYAPFADSNCDACPLCNYNRAQPERMVGYSCDLAWGQLPYEAAQKGGK